MREWLEDLTDEMAAADEHGTGSEPEVWARSLLADLGRDGAVEAVLGAPGVPAAARQIALEALS